MGTHRLVVNRLVEGIVLERMRPLTKKPVWLPDRASVNPGVGACICRYPFTGKIMSFEDCSLQSVEEIACQGCLSSQHRETLVHTL